MERPGTLSQLMTYKYLFHYEALQSITNSENSRIAQSQFNLLRSFTEKGVWLISESS
jgi:hypothetical protein